MKFIFSLLMFFSISASVFASLPADSLVLEPIASDSNAVKVAGYVYDAVSNSDEKPLDAIKSYRLALKTNTVKDELWEADIRTGLGKLMLRVKSKEALPQLLKADALYKKNKNLQGRAETLNLIALNYEKQGLFSEAEKVYNDLIRIQNVLGESVLAGNVASHMADQYLKKQNYVEALKYASIAESSYYKVCRKDSLGSVYYKLAFIKKKLNNPKTASSYIIDKALPFFTATDNFAGRNKSFDFLGRLYLEQKRFSEAKWFYIQANTLSRTLNDTVGTIKSLINLGIVKIAIGDMVLAKQDLREAEILAKLANHEYLLKGVKAKYTSMFKNPAPVIVSAEKKIPGPVKQSAKPKITPVVFAGYADLTKNTTATKAER